MVSFLSMSFQALRDRKLRSTLTILMVVIGVTLIVAINGLSYGIIDYVNQQFDTLGPNLLMVRGEFSDRDLNDMATIEGIEHVVPYTQRNVLLTTSKGEKSGRLIGIDTTKLPLLYPTYELVEGEDLAPGDSFGILLGNSLSEFDDGIFAKVGETIKASYLVSQGEMPEYKTKSFVIRGIGGEVGSSNMFVPFDSSAYITLSTANLFFGYDGEYDGLYVLTTNPDLNDQVMETIEGTFDDASVISPATLAEAATNIMGALGGFINAIALVSLGVAAVGIITTLWTSMMERYKEIGTLKALGYSKGSILFLFLNEALIIGVVGGLAGIIFGIFGGTLLSTLIFGGLTAAFSGAEGGGMPDGGGQTGGGFGGAARGISFNISPVFDPALLLIVWVVAVILSVVAGFYPAKKAADLDPVVALRKE
ncbi:MAG: ABC transporter permease [Candidatus Hodarchaeota archaeon]